MSIDPKWLAEKHRGKTIDKPRACACGYNLTGLQAGRNCPECGKVIPFISGAIPGAPKFTSFPEPVLRRVARATTLMSLGLTALSGGYYAVWFLAAFRITGLFDLPRTVGTTMLLAIVLPGALAWALGAFWLCRRRRDQDVPFSAPTPADLLVGRPAWFGPLAWLSSLLWPLAAGLTAGSAIAGGHDDPTGLALAYAAAASAILASWGMSLIALVLRDLAHAADDDYANNRFHAMTLGGPIAGTFMALIPMVPYILGLSLAFTSIAITLFSFLIATAIWHFNSAGWSLSSTCRWALGNAESAQDRDERFRAEAARALRASQGRARGAPKPGKPRAG